MPVQPPDDLEPSPETPPPTPRWVLALGLIAVVLVVGFVILMLVGGHTPRMNH